MFMDMATLSLRDSQPLGRALAGCPVGRKRLILRWARSMMFTFAHLRTTCQFQPCALFSLNDIVDYPLTIRLPPLARIILDDQLIVQSGINIPAFRHL